jgi:diguanylate cyclase
MAQVYSTRRSGRIFRRSASGGLALGALVAIAPLLLIAPEQYLGREGIVAAVAACSTLLSVALVVAARRLEGVPGQASRPFVLGKCLRACALGLFVVAIQCAALSISTVAQSNFWHLLPAGIRFEGHRIDSLLVVCGGSFLLSSFIAAISIYRFAKNERDDVQGEMHSSLLAALGRQQANRSENVFLAGQIADREKAEMELARMVHIDALTGLPNRTYLLAAMKSELGVAPASPDSGKYLMHIGLDGFRSVNDLLGHRAGDRVLKEVAARLLKWTASGDTVVRISGDEFAIFSEGVKSPDHARRMAERILAALEKPVHLNRIVLPIAASIGICELSTRHNSPEEVLRDADTAMYRAKKEGGNRCVFYDTAMLDEALNRIQTTLQLRSALDRAEFELFYQPFVNMQDNSIYGVESLIRWNHPKRGLLSAGQFVQHIESAGYSGQVGQWVLERACRDFAAIREVVPGDFIMSVNVSERQLRESSFVHELKAVIGSFQVDPSLLQLEVIESAFLGDAERIGAALEAIRSMGIRIALDDFGTGYSALGYLQKFPIDTLKIDQSFVRGLRGNSLNSNIVKFLVKLAESAGMTILAEGVEEPEQVDALLASGCRHAQGFLYSRPIPLDALLTLLQRGIEAPASNHSIHSLAS